MEKVPFEQIGSIDIDAQNCFTWVCPNELPVNGGEEIVDELNANKALAKYRVASKEAHSPEAQYEATNEFPQFSKIINSPNMDIRWNRHGVPGTVGFNLINGLPDIGNGGYDLVVYKGVELNMHPYGACYHDFAEKVSTRVIEFFQAKKVELIIAGGLATDYCVKKTVLQLLKAGLRVVVNLAACRGIDQKTTADAIEEMKQAGAIIMNNAAEIKAAFVLSEE